MERIFGRSANQDPNQNELLRQLKADLDEYRSLIERVYIQFVFKGDLEAAEKSTGLQYRREDLENKKYHIDYFFGERPVDMRVEFVSDYRNPPPPPPNTIHRVSFTDRISLPASNGHALHVGFVKLMDLHRMYKGLGPKFFSRNIRAGLSPDNPPNRKIRSALMQIVLKQQEPPEVFTFNHNGVTLAAEHVDFEDGCAVIKVPRLLNGAQTVTCFSRFLEENEDNPALKANKSQLEAIGVLAKIVVAEIWGDFITNVTISNNQQNPVDPWNLRANDKVQCDLQDKFREESGIYYSRQENAFQNLSDDDLEEMRIEDSRDIRIRPLAQTFLALQGKIDRMSQLREIFEVQKTYDDTFRESYLKCDVRRLILIYKVHLVINTPIRLLEAKVAQDFIPAVRRAKNLIWALLIQGLLNDNKIDNLLEYYGMDLAKQVDFRTHLESLASSRILPLLRETFKDETYRQKINDGKFDFLRTQEIFKRCMNAANEKYGWIRGNL